MAATAVEGLRAVYGIAEDGPIVTTHPLSLVRAVPIGGEQVHDANIVATMLAHAISRLLTFNSTDFRRFEPIIAVLTP